MTQVFRLSASHPWQLLIGLSVWAFWFVVVYAGVSVACSAAPPAAERATASWINLGLIAFTLGIAGVLGFAAFACAKGAKRVGSGDDRDGLRRFVTSAATALYAVAAVSTLFVGLPLLFVWPCV